jgi:hypothetical protein
VESAPKSSIRVASNGDETGGGAGLSHQDGGRRTGTGRAEDGDDQYEYEHEHEYEYDQDLS